MYLKYTFSVERPGRQDKSVKLHSDLEYEFKSAPPCCSKILTIDSKNLAKLSKSTKINYD